MIVIFEGESQDTQAIISQFEKERKSKDTCINGLFIKDIVNATMSKDSSVIAERVSDLNLLNVTYNTPVQRVVYILIEDDTNATGDDDTQERAIIYRTLFHSLLAGHDAKIIINIDEKESEDIARILAASVKKLES